MFRTIDIAFGWVMGYFVFTFPIRMAMPHSLTYSLMHSIIGVSVAVGILLWGLRK